MYCDWSAQLNSYIPVYNAIPAHDWSPVSGTSFAEPAQQIVVTEHRNDSLTTTDAGDGDGHKGTSGFWPSQPCGNLNPSLGLPSPTSATKGNPQSTATGYTYFNAAFLTQAYAAARAAGGIGTKPYVTFFKDYDVIRSAWDRHSGGKGATTALPTAMRSIRTSAQFSILTRMSLEITGTPLKSLGTPAPASKLG
jgi:hypothetical protein